METSEVRDGEDKESKITDTNNNAIGNETESEHGENSDQEISSNEQNDMTQTGKDEATRVGHAGDGRPIHTQAEGAI
jgi:hypothetical protein